MSESKSVLREEARRHLVRMDIREEDPEEAAAHFFKEIAPDKDKVVAAYWPKGREFDTSPFLEPLLQAGNVCALPVVQKGSLNLKFARWDEGVELKKGPFDILQPDSEEWVDPNVLIVPMLAFDRKGYRLGHGGGYYDTTLEYLRGKKDILAVGVAYAQQACLFNLPIEEHDQRLDWIITPQGAQDFRK